MPILMMIYVISDVFASPSIDLYYIIMDYASMVWKLYVYLYYEIISYYNASRSLHVRILKFFERFWWCLDVDNEVHDVWECFIAC